MLEVRRSITALIAATAIVACSGGDDEGTTEPTPAIDITASAATATVTQGGTASVTVTLTRSGGFTGDVTLAVTGLSTNLTAPNVTIPSGSTTGVVTYTAAATAATGTANTTITATGTGVTAKTAAVAVTVNAAPTPSFTMALTPATQSVNQGSNATVTVNLTRTNGFTGTVNLAATGLPNGVTAAFAPAAATGNTSTLTLTASATATTGPATVTVTGTSGTITQTATLALTVNAPAAAGYTLAASAATVTAGATGTSNITITRTGGFADAVTLAVEGLPTGVTGAFAPNNTTTNASVLTLTAAANAAPGTTTITVKGTAAGQPEKTATFQLTVAAAAGYTVAITEPNLTIAAGGTTTANITITRTGGFTGAVDLTLENLPAGVTGAFNPASATGNASVLTLTAAANAAAAGQSILVRGKSGTLDKSASVLLTVTAAAGSYTLALAPTTLTVQQGASGNTTVNITRTGGFAGTVDLTATGLPAGVTAAFNPAAATANTSTLTLTASATATTGPATVTVTGTSGAITQTATLALTVSAAVGGSGNTTYEFCTVADTPLWLAVQNDAPNGPWARVTPTGTKFQFNVTGTKSAVAYVTGTTSAGVSAASLGLAGKLARSLKQDLISKGIRFGSRRASYSSSAVDEFTLNIIYGTQAELNTSGGQLCLPGTGKTVNGSVAGLSGATQSANVSLGPESPTGQVTAASPNFTITNVPDGPLDLIATRQNLNATTFAYTIDKLIIRRGLNQANNSTIPVLDFNAAEAVAPVTPALTINNLNGELAYGLSYYFTSTGSGASGAPLLFSGLPSAGPFTYVGVPASSQATGDLHLVLAQAVPSLQSIDQFRFAGSFFKEAVAKTVTLGAALTAPTVSVAATTPYVRFRATAAIQTEYNKAINLQFIQSNASASRTVAFTATAGYLNGLTSYDFSVPDFTGVAGWDNNWGPKTGAETFWTVSAYGYTGVGFGSANPLEGSTYTGAARTGSLTP
jgi:uncharacterized membrane protein